MTRQKKKHAVLAPALERWTGPLVLFPAIALVLLTVLWSVTIHLIRVEREGAVAKAVDSSNELLETYEAQMVRNLETINQALRTTKYAYELKHSGDTLDRLRDNGLLPPAMLFTIEIADRNGQIVASTRPAGADGVLQKNAFPPFAHPDSDAVFVTPPTATPPSGEARIYFSRKLDTPDGKFDGIVLLSVEPAYFTSGYDHARLGNQGVLGLLDAKGTFVVARIGDEVSWGQSAQIVPAAPDADVRHTGSISPVQSWDGVWRYLRARQLHGFPLAVVVGLSRDEQLQAFEADRRGELWKAASISVGLVAALAAAAAFFWHLTASRRRARRIQETYYAASNASLDACFVLRSMRSSGGAIDDFMIEDANRQALALFRQTREQIIGKTLCTLMPESRQNGVFDDLVQVAENRSVDEREWENRDSRVGAPWLRRQFVSVEEGVVVILRDISERKRAETLRVQQTNVLEMIATGTPLKNILEKLLQLLASQQTHLMASILLADQRGKRLLYGAAIGLSEKSARKIEGTPIAPNASACGVAAYRREPVFDTDLEQHPLWQDLCADKSQDPVRAVWAIPILSHQKRALGTFALYRTDASQPTELQMQLVDFVVRLAAIAIERQHSEDHIRHMAHHDALTGLPNRSLLEDRVSQALRHAQRYRRQMTVIFIDLDNFKLINDSMGHKAGDELLKVVAQRMVGNVRSTDTVIRFGGDEFVIVLPDQPLDTDAAALPLQKIHESIAQPIEIEGREVHVTCSMGFATYPRDGEEPQVLLMNADAAMYRAKELGRNNSQFFTPEMHQRMQEKAALQDGLRNALTRREFFLVYQPQLDLKHNRIVGMEALIRWQHPALGLVPPTRFIPLAEESKLIVEIGNWVLHTACRQNKAWQDAGMTPCVVSVNVSARQFKEGSLANAVAHALYESGLSPEYLELEVTESLIMQDLNQAITVMDELRAMGVQLSIDDFGTGYSSLSVLKSFPIARLKLDRSFVSALPDDEDDKTITKAIISLGHQMKLRIVAEGVESEPQLTFLREHGCDEMQGYYFSKPLLPPDIEALFKTHFPSQDTPSNPAAAPL